MTVVIERPCCARILLRRAGLGLAGCYGGASFHPFRAMASLAACAKLIGVMGEPISRCVADHLAERDAALRRSWRGVWGVRSGWCAPERVSVVSDGRRQR